MYYVFDLLEFEGKDLTQLPLWQRKELARKLLQDSYGPVRFSGLPSGTRFGAALFEYDGKDFRTFKVTGGAFTDPFAPHDARVYRFRLQG